MMYKPDVLIYHDPCRDGYTAAYACYLQHGSDVIYVPAKYGDHPPYITDRKVVIVDFSYPRDMLIAIAKVAEHIVILDHHESAEAELKQWATPIVPDPEDIEGLAIKAMAETGSPIVATFDMEHSGAALAWRFFHRDTPQPNLVSYVQDHDLYKHHMAGSREVNAFISSFDFTSQNWDLLHAQLNTMGGIKEAIASGETIERKFHKDLRELIGICMRFMFIGGYHVKVANLPPTFATEAGNSLAEGMAFGATYYDRGDGKRMFSLRSRKGDPAAVNVAEIAKLYGGGGHANAAGFIVPIGWEGDPGRPTSFDVVEGKFGYD